MTMVDSIDQIDWQRADLRDPTKRQVLAESIAEIESGSVEHSLFHDLAWLLEAEGRGPDDVRVYICRAGARPSGHAPFVVQPWLMRFRIGEVTLFSRSFERLHISGGPVTRSTDSGEVRADLVAKLFAQVRPLLTRRQVIYLEGVVKGSEVELAIAANSTRRMFRVIEPTPRYERRLIRFPSNFEEYLRSLKTQTRQNLRNTQRKLEKHLTGNLRLVRYDRTDQISEFVGRAVAISKKTYQWHLLGLGLRKADQLEQTLVAMARHGWTRCYLLECDGAATAFMIGYLYFGTYYYVDVGFDPDWEKWSVGTVLHMEVLRDLMDGEGQARSFDFSSGSGVHKKRFSNDSREEANYILVPRSARNAVFLGAFHAMNALSAAAVGLLERLHLKAAIKRLVRRHATGKATDD